MRRMSRPAAGATDRCTLAFRHGMMEMKLSASIATLLLAPCISLQLSARQPQDGRDQWPEGSAMHTAYVFADRRDEAQARLEESQAQLVRLAAAHAPVHIGNRASAAIEGEHATWLAYRDAACELYGALTGAGGTWPSTHALGCEADWTARRLDTVNAAVRCIEALPEETRDLDLPDCLTPLEPPVPGIGER